MDTLEYFRKSSILRNKITMIMVWLMTSITMLLIWPISASAVTPQAAGINYDIVYVRYPRRGDSDVIELPDGENPYSIEPGADLVLLHPNGSEEILVDCRIEGQESIAGGEANCSVQDPAISYDGKWVYYSKYVNMGMIAPANFDRAWITLSANSHIFKMALDVPASERKEIQLTTVGSGFATDKLAGNGTADKIKDFGIRDLGPTPLPDGRLLFTSNRDAVMPYLQGVKQRVSAVSASTSSQVHIMSDHDGSTPNKNLHVVGHSNLHHVQHPTMLKDGRILFTNWDDAGLRADYATATLYVDHPDGGHLEQFLEPHHEFKRVEHFVAEISSGNVVVTNYYPRMASWGFGTLLRTPVNIEGPQFIAKNGNTSDDDDRYFSRKGTVELTPHTTGTHKAPSDLSGRYSTPSAAPGDSLLVSFSSGPVTNNPPGGGAEFPRLDAGIYFITNAGTAKITDSAKQLVELKNDPNHNEMWPRAVTPYQNIHGIAAPSLTPPKDEYAPTERNRGIIAGSPVGITGTSSMQNRESAALGDDRFNYEHKKGGGRDKGWVVQGADAGLVKNADLWGVRILVMTPDRFHEPWNSTSIEKNEGLLPDDRINTHVKGYYSHSNENWKILGEFPVRNSSGQADPDGEQDTSWLAKIPADTPHLIQSIDRYGMTLSTEQTWRHVRAGETFASCGGCHAHAKEGVGFENKLADSASYEPVDLVSTTPMINVDGSNNPKSVNRTKTGLWGVEFRRDVLPILKNNCASCHTSANNQAPASGARLAMFDSSLSGFASEVRTYRSLAKDDKEQFTHGTANPAGIPAGQSVYHFPQMSRYVRALQARASYLVWKLYDQRLDGRTNNDLPGGLGNTYEDLNYVSGSCPSSSLLANDEKSLISRWVDLGAPINLDRPRMRYTDDVLLPIVNMEFVKSEDGKAQVRFGVLDIESGIDYSRSQVEISHSGTGTIVVPLSDIAFDTSSGVGLYALNVNASQITQASPLQVSAVVYDNAGNHQSSTRDISEESPVPVNGGGSASGTTPSPAASGSGSGGGGGSLSMFFILLLLGSTILRLRRA